MSSEFQKCLKIVLHHEGIDPDRGKTGWVQHPQDNDGGATNYGITKYTYEAFKGRPVTIDEMRNMPYSDVEEIYEDRYWDKVRGDDLCQMHGNPSVALSLFDWGVNSGPRRSSKAFQQIIGANRDGKIGPKTLALAKGQSAEHIVNQMYKLRQSFYESLTSKFAVFGKGWSRRNAEVQKEALSMI